MGQLFFYMVLHAILKLYMYDKYNTYNKAVHMILGESTDSLVLGVLEESPVSLRLCCHLMNQSQH